METVKLGIVGVACRTEQSGDRTEIDNLAVKAVCDIDERKLKTISTIYPDLELFSDYRELIMSGKVDAVLVAVPHPMHAEISAFALKNGLHVLSEKPIDSSYGAALKAVTEAEKSGNHRRRNARDPLGNRSLEGKESRGGG